MNLREGSSVRRLLRHVPPGQLLRYAVVGVWNTLFGYAVFALFEFLLSRRYPTYGYLMAGALSSVLSVSVAFLGYKWFVFKSKGNYLREWALCMAVYGSSIAIGLILLPVAVFVIRRSTAMDGRAPYVAAAIVACFNAGYNFLGNKTLTFRSLYRGSPAGAPLIPIDQQEERPRA